MRLKQFVYFSAVVEHGSFNGAAKDLYIAQSSLSTTVADLEKELGFDLLIRTKQGVVLTGMGQVVYDNIKQVLNSLDEYEKEWKDTFAARAAVNAAVVAAVVPSLYTVFSNDVISSLKVDYPNLKIAVFEGRGPLLYEYMCSGKVDMVFSDCIESGYEAEKKSLTEKGFIVKEIGYDHYKIGIKAGNKLADKESLTKEDVKSLQLACYSGGDLPADEFIRRGFSPDSRIEYNSIEKIYQAVLSGNAAGCLPEKATQLSARFYSKRPDIKLLTLEGFDVPFMHYGSHKNQPEIKKVYDIIEEKFIAALNKNK